MKPALVLSALVLTVAAAAPASGQTIEEARNELADRLKDIHFAGAFAGLVTLSDELELSGASYRIDDPSRTDLSAVSLPFRKTFRPWGEGQKSVYFEGVAGYARASQETDDLYGGAIPGFETAVEADWITYGGLLGLGLEIDLTGELSITPIVNVGLAHIESQADYSGPGSGFSASLFDGLALNWDASTASGGGAVRLDWVRPFGAGLRFELVGRYDIRWTRTIHEDESAQEFSDRLQLLTLRGELSGPTGLKPFHRPLSWRTQAGFRRFVEGDLFLVRDFVLIGGSLELDVSGGMPFGRAVSLKGGVILGGEISGYTVGLGLSF